VHVLIKAFEQLETAMQLVIIGDTPYFSQYAEELRQTHDQRIRFLGSVYGTPCRQILQQAYVYVHPLLADGTSPSLLQAMAASNCIVASDLPETLGVIGNAGLTFRHGDVNDLLRQMRHTLEHPTVVEGLRMRARRRVEDHYTWPAIATRYSVLYQRIARSPVRKNGVDPI
jgi:glycosyltransferase involved in cell wall biosynthesis